MTVQFANERMGFGQERGVLMEPTLLNRSHKEGVGVLSGRKLGENDTLSPLPHTVALGGLLSIFRLFFVVLGFVYCFDMSARHLKRSVLSFLCMVKGNVATLVKNGLNRV